MEYRLEKENWIHERVSFDAAYNNERIIAHIFIPKNSKTPYQTVLYGPGAGVQFQTQSDSIESYFEFPAFLSHFLDAGRAVIFPIIKGTFERREEITVSMIDKESQRYTEYMTQIIKDYRRTIDYLESRDEFDSAHIAFYGCSWGSIIGSVLSPIENRIKVNIFVSGGLQPHGRAEVNQNNFCKHITVPTLLINGRYDSIFPLEFRIMPFFDGLGTIGNNKKLVLTDTDHVPEMDVVIDESKKWLDNYFGKVDLLLSNKDGNLR